LAERAIFKQLEPVHPSIPLVPTKVGTQSLGLGVSLASTTRTRSGPRPSPGRAAVLGL